jgi:DNA repair protein RadC
MPEPATRPSYRTIRELSEDERPRERLLRHGPEVLSDAELVAIVLGSGLAGENVVDLARRILEQHGGLPGLVRADARTLQRLRGVGAAKAAQLAAAVELGRRVQRLVPEDRPHLGSPEAVYAYVAGRFVGRTKEQLLVLALDTRGRLLGTPAVLGGTVLSVAVRPAEVFREAVVLEATGVILVHNHPSGDPTPSADDIRVTKQLAEAGALLGIDLVDHVIVGLNRYVSMRREGIALR